MKDCYRSKDFHQREMSLTIFSRQDIRQYNINECNLLLRKDVLMLAEMSRNFTICHRNCYFAVPHIPSRYHHHQNNLHYHCYHTRSKPYQHYVTPQPYIIIVIIVINNNNNNNIADIIILTIDKIISTTLICITIH